MRISSVTRHLARAVYRSFSGKAARLDSYVVFHFDEYSIPSMTATEKEIFLEALALPYSDELKALGDAITKIADSHVPSNRICVQNDFDGIWISMGPAVQGISISLESEYWSAMDLFKTFEKSRRGIIYEELCRCFLQDLGIEAARTKASNDKGIDIVGRYRTSLSEDKSELVFDDYVYIIGQAKFLDSKVDTPVIRRLIGDSLFIRFSQLEYLDLAHNAIHQIVFSHSGFTENATAFCKVNKVMRLETAQMITILASKENCDTSRSIAFVREMVRTGGVVQHLVQPDGPFWHVN